MLDLLLLHFLVNATEPVDPEIYDPGTLPIRIRTFNFLLFTFYF